MTVVDQDLQPDERERFHLARRRKGLSQRAVAKQAGVAQATLSRWERDRTNLAPDTVARLRAAIL